MTIDKNNYILLIYVTMATVVVVHSISNYENFQLNFKEVKWPSYKKVDGAGSYW